MNNIQMLKTIINHLLKEDDQTRTKMLKEDSVLLRSYVRHCIHEVKLEIKDYNKKENLIREAKIHQIPSVMQTAQRGGMISMEKSIEGLVGSGVINIAETKT